MDLDFEMIVTDVDSRDADARTCEMRWAGQGGAGRDPSAWGRLVVE